MAAPAHAFSRLTLSRAEKERQKAEKKAKQAAQAAAQEAANKIHNVEYLSFENQQEYEPMGDLTRVMSTSRTGRNFARVADLESDNYTPGDTVWLRGRLQSIRVKGGSCFLVLRQDSFHTVQACYFKDKENPEQSQKMIRYLKSLTVESIVDLEGTITEAQVQSTSVKTLELKIERIHSVSKAAAQLPFLVEDAARSHEEVEASQDTERPFPRLGQVRLVTRIMVLCIVSSLTILYHVGTPFGQSLDGLAGSGQQCNHAYSVGHLSAFPRILVFSGLCRDSYS